MQDKTQAPTPQDPHRFASVVLHLGQIEGMPPAVLDGLRALAKKAEHRAPENRRDLWDDLRALIVENVTPDMAAFEESRAVFQGPDLGTYPCQARDFGTTLLYQRLVNSFRPGGRWGDFSTSPNVVHQLLVSAAFLADAEPINAEPSEITPEKGAELLALDIHRLGSTLDHGTAESFGLLAACVMSRPNSAGRRMATRELQAAIFLAADAAAREHAQREAEERGVYTVGEGEDRACTFYPAKGIAFDISYAEAKDFVPQIPKSLEALRREVAFEQARKHFGLPAV